MSTTNATSIPDPHLEGSIRKLVVLAHLAAATLAPFDPKEEALLDGLKDVAGDVRARLDDKRGTG